MTSSITRLARTAPTKSPIRTIRPAGDRAALLELDDPESVRNLHAELARDPVEGLIDAVPGATTLLVVTATSDGSTLAAVLRRANQLASTPTTPECQPTIRLQVRYDGPDLDEVAARCQLSTGELIRRHSGRIYTAAFLGLVPGFAYLTGLDPALRLPRRDSPRTAVPPGSVAIASDYTGVYPHACPGGWHLLGTTTRCLWNLEWDMPALLTPGTPVTFEPT